MKIKIINRDILIYILNKSLDLESSSSDLEDYIKDIILRVKKKRIRNLSGSYNVKVYQNHRYGIIIYMEHDEDIDYFPDIIDLNVKIYKNSNLYFITDDYFLISDKEYRLIDNKYYVNIDDFSDREMLFVIEHGDIVYN